MGDVIEIKSGPLTVPELLTAVILLAWKSEKVARENAEMAAKYEPN